MRTTISQHCAQWCAMGGARQSWPASRTHCCHTYTTESQAQDTIIVQETIYMET